MEWNRGPAAVRMTVLLVGAALSNFCKPMFLQKCRSLPRLENRRTRHLSDPDCLHPNKLRLQRRFSILEQHAEDFL